MLRILKAAGAILALALASSATNTVSWMYLLLAFALVLAFVFTAVSAIWSHTLARRYPRVALGVMSVMPIVGTTAAFTFAQ